MGLSHVDEKGRARMVDISAKPVSLRRAVAEGKVCLQPETRQRIRDNTLQKGDVLAAARLAGIGGAKRTAELIPLCHNIPIDQISLEISLFHDHLKITAITRCQARTGIEMEALTAVSVAALTVYDMCKAVDKTMSITDIRLVEKTKEIPGEKR
jgi:cyclic pyranopterin phosphate synthase